MRKKIRKPILATVVLQELALVTQNTNHNCVHNSGHKSQLKRLPSRRLNKGCMFIVISVTPLVEIHDFPTLCYSEQILVEEPIAIPNLDAPNTNIHETHL